MSECRAWAHCTPHFRAPAGGSARPEEAQRARTEQYSSGLPNWPRGRRRTAGGRLAHSLWGLNENMGPGTQNSDLFRCQIGRRPEVHFQPLLSTNTASGQPHSSQALNKGRGSEISKQLLVNSRPPGTMLSSQLQGSLQAGLALPTPISPAYARLTFWNQEKLVLASETNPDFLEFCEGEWRCCPSAP